MHMDVHLNWYREKAVDAAHVSVVPQRQSELHARYHSCEHVKHEAKNGTSFTHCKSKVNSYQPTDEKVAVRSHDVRLRAAPALLEQP